MGYVVAICLLLVIVSQSIIFPSFHTPFFRWQFNRLNVAENIQIEKDELMYVTSELLDYMRRNRSTMDGITAVVAGQEREFFSEIEKRHMMDVQHLYSIAFMVRSIAFFLMIGLVLGMILLKPQVLYILARCTREVMTGFLLIAAIVAGAVAFNFQRAFDVFHLMFFPYNNDWRLNPTTDLLINMVPTGFFIHISIFIGALMAGAAILVILVSSIYLHRLPRTAHLKP